MAAGLLRRTLALLVDREGVELFCETMIRPFARVAVGGHDR